MIIIETKTGPKFVNDQTIESLEFNAEEGVVYVAPINGIMVTRMPFANDVERVRYVNQTQPENYEWKGSLTEEAERGRADVCRNNQSLRNFKLTLMKLHPDIYEEVERFAVLKTAADEQSNPKT